MFQHRGCLQSTFLADKNALKWLLMRPHSTPFKVVRCAGVRICEFLKMPGVDSYRHHCLFISAVCFQSQKDYMVHEKPIASSAGSSPPHYHILGRHTTTWFCVFETFHDSAFLSDCDLFNQMRLIKSRRVAVENVPHGPSFEAIPLWTSHFFVALSLRLCVAGLVFVPPCVSPMDMGKVIFTHATQTLFTHSACKK